MNVYLAFNAPEAATDVRLGDLRYLRKWKVQNKEWHGETLTPELAANIVRTYTEMYNKAPESALLLVPGALFTKLYENRGKSVWFWTADA